MTQKAFRRFAILVGVTLLWFILVQISSGILVALDIDMSSSLFNILSSTVIPYFIIVPFIYFLIRKMSVQTLGANFHYNWQQILILAIIINGLLEPITNFLLDLVLVNLTSVEDLSQLEEGEASLIFNAFLLLVFNPIFEGIFFRKILLERVQASTMKKRAILGGIIFMFPHLLAFSIMGIYSFGFPGGLVFAMVGTLRILIIGSCLAYVTLSTGYLREAAILHASTNFYSVFLAEFLQGHPFIFNAFYYIFMPALALYFLFRLRNKKELA